jgi:polysaccharide export outer membrane protein
MPNLFRISIALVVSACTAAAALGASPPDYKLAAGDSIKVQVYQNPDLTVEARVSENGTISYPLVGSVAIGGMSIPQAEKTVASALERGKILKQPQVNILLLQVRGNQVSVLGEVQRPGRFPLETTTVRVSDMLASAGGISPQGNDQVVVSGTRDGKPFRKTIDVPSLFRNDAGADDVLLAPGDTLYVTKAPTFYIYGAAQRPGTYKVERGMTMQQALAIAGGPNARGSERMRLDRKSEDGRLQQLEPRLTDVVQPGDVLFVKESLF